MSLRQLPLRAKIYIVETHLYAHLINHNTEETICHGLVFNTENNV